MGRIETGNGCIVSFPADDHIKMKWIQFVNRANWEWNKTSRLCEDHFQEHEIKRYNKKILLTNKDVIPSKFTEEQKKIPPSVLPNINPPRKPPTIRGIIPDELQEWRERDRIKSFQDLTDKKCPSEFSFRHLVFANGLPVVKDQHK